MEEKTKVDSNKLLFEPLTGNASDRKQSKKVNASAHKRMSVSNPQSTKSNKKETQAKPTHSFHSVDMEIKPSRNANDKDTASNGSYDLLYVCMQTRNSAAVRNIACTYKIFITMFV